MQRAPAVAHRAVDLRGHRALPVAIALKRKLQALQRRSRLLAPFVQRGHPLRIGHGAAQKDLFQLGARALAAVADFAAGGADVAQRDFRAGQALVFADQIGVDLPLREVRRPVIRAGQPRIARGRLDLQHLHAAVCAAHGVGAPLHAQRDFADRHLARDVFLRNPALAERRLQPAVDLRAFVHAVGGRHRKIAALKREFRQRADVDRVHFCQRFSLPGLTASPVNGKL